MNTPTAELVLYSPQEAALQKQIQNLATAAGKAVVDCEARAKSATDLAQLIRATIKAIDDDRKTLTEPLNGFLRAINSRYKEHSSRAEQARQELDAKLLAWRRKEAERIKKEQEAADAAARLERERLRAQAEAEAEALRKRGEETAAEMVMQTAQMTLIPSVVVPEKRSTEGQRAASSTRKVWKFEVVDFAAVSDEYKTLNSTAVYTQIRAGVRELAGLRIFEHDELVVRRV